MASRPKLHWVMLLALMSCSEEGEEDGGCIVEFASGKSAEETLISDEAYRAIVSAADRLEIDDARAPSFDVPAEGQSFSATEEPPTFAWTPAKGARRGSPRRGFLAAAKGLWGSFSVIREAHAHGPPTTGPAFLAEVMSSSGSCVISYITSENSWPLSQSRWSRLASAGGSFEARVTYAYIRENVIEEGPFRAASNRTFQVEK